MPFSTSLMAEFIEFPTALVLYWLNVLALGAMLFATWRYAKHAGLIQAEVTAVIDQSVERRIIIAQALYALARRFACSIRIGASVSLSLYS